MTIFCGEPRCRVCLFAKAYLTLLIVLWAGLLAGCAPPADPCASGCGCVPQRGECELPCKGCCDDATPGGCPITPPTVSK